MASKAFIVFGVLLSMALLSSAGVAARELAEENNKEKTVNGNGLQDQKYGGGGNYGRGDGGYYRGGGGDYSHGGGGYNRGGGGDYGHGGNGYHHGGGGYHGYPPRCYYGCCRPGYYSGCACCASADEIPEAAYLPDHN